MKNINNKLIFDPTREILIIGEDVKQHLINKKEIIEIFIDIESFNINNIEYSSNGYISIVYVDNILSNFIDTLYENEFSVIRLNNTTELKLEIFVDFGKNITDTINIYLDKNLEIDIYANILNNYKESEDNNDKIILSELNINLTCNGSVELFNNN